MKALCSPATSVAKSAPACLSPGAGCPARTWKAAHCPHVVNEAPSLPPAQRFVHTQAQAQAERPVTSQDSPSLTRRIQFPLAHELIQGALVKWTVSAPGQAPPTAVLVHGILGSKRNLQRLARQIVEGFPSWQVLLVDLRCHGDSAALPIATVGPHSVASAAADVINLLRSLKLFPNMLIGHSFGGKCVMSMVQQFGGGMALPRPVQVWALDALPGQVRAGVAGGRDHPSVLLETLLSVTTPVTSRKEVVDRLLHRGFSSEIAHWAATNLRPVRDLQGPQLDRVSVSDGIHPHGALAWSVDLQGISDMYRSYEETCMWPLLEAPPQGLQMDFVRAEGSNFRWADDEPRITGLGHNVHLLRDAGHWVHTDNPTGLMDILAPSFGAQGAFSRRARSMSIGLN